MLIYRTRLMERAVLGITSEGEETQENIFVYNCHIVGDQSIMEKYIFNSPYVTHVCGRRWAHSFMSLEFEVGDEKVIINLFDQFHVDVHFLIVVEDFTKEENVIKTLELYMHAGNRFHRMNVAIGPISGDEDQRASTVRFLCPSDESICIDIENNSLLDLAVFAHHALKRNKRSFVEDYEEYLKEICDFAMNDTPGYARCKSMPYEEVIGTIAFAKEVLRKVREKGRADKYAYVTYEYTGFRKNGKVRLTFGNDSEVSKEFNPEENAKLYSVLSGRKLNESKVERETTELGDQVRAQARALLADSDEDS